MALRRLRRAAGRVRFNSLRGGCLYQVLIFARRRTDRLTTTAAGIWKGRQHAEWNFPAGPNLRADTDADGDERRDGQSPEQGAQAPRGLAALKGDGKFQLTYAPSAAGGVTLSVVQNARTVTIGPFPFAPAQLDQAIDYVNRELKLRANL